MDHRVSTNFEQIVFIHIKKQINMICFRMYTKRHENNFLFMSFVIICICN